MGGGLIQGRREGILVIMSCSREGGPQGAAMLGRMGLGDAAVVLRESTDTDAKFEVTDLALRTPN